MGEPHPKRVIFYVPAPIAWRNGAMLAGDHGTPPGKRCIPGLPVPLPCEPPTTLTGQNPKRIAQPGAL
jgi:hypothetical protein